MPVLNSLITVSGCDFSGNYYKNHPRFKELYNDEDGDGKIDYGKKRVFNN